MVVDTKKPVIWAFIDGQWVIAPVKVTDLRPYWWAAVVLALIVVVTAAASLAGLI